MRNSCSRNLVSAIHSLYFMQKPYTLQLQFEEFLYSCIAIDTCYAVIKRRYPKEKNCSHNERIKWMCKKLKIKVPDWAKYRKYKYKEKTKKTKTKLSKLRNKVFHEGLYANALLGQKPYKHKRFTSITFEMKNFVCRLIATILGVQDATYRKKEAFDRGLSKIKLT